jgi:hypothetical protein
LTRGISPELLSLPPAPNEWSALECLQHLIDAERNVFPVRLSAFLDGRDLTAFDPDSQGTKPIPGRSPSALALEFDQLRQASLKALEPMTLEDFNRRARHAELGMVSLGEMIHEWAGHDLMHTVQAERAVMQPFIRGCGPWQSYFVDHVAKQRL